MTTPTTPKSKVSKNSNRRGFASAAQRLMGQRHDGANPLELNPLANYGNLMQQAYLQNTGQPQSEFSPQTIDSREPGFGGPVGTHGAHDSTTYGQPITPGLINQMYGSTLNRQIQDGLGQNAELNYYGPGNAIRGNTDGDFQYLQSLSHLDPQQREINLQTTYGHDPAYLQWLQANLPLYQAQQQIHDQFQSTGQDLNPDQLNAILTSHGIDPKQFILGDHVITPQVPPTPLPQVAGTPQVPHAQDARYGQLMDATRQLFLAKGRQLPTGLQQPITTQPVPPGEHQSFGGGIAAPSNPGSLLGTPPPPVLNPTPTTGTPGNAGSVGQPVHNNPGSNPNSGVSNIVGSNSAGMTPSVSPGNLLGNHLLPGFTSGIRPAGGLPVQSIAARLVGAR